MARIICFEEIHSWKKSRELTKKIYEVTSKGDFNLLIIFTM